jgi:hypothetical protein
MPVSRILSSFLSIIVREQIAVARALASSLLLAIAVPIEYHARLENARRVA